MGKRKRRNVILNQEAVQIKYCILMRTSVAINHPKRFVLVKTEDVIRHEASGLIQCDSTWLKKAMNEVIASRPTVRLLRGEGPSKIYEKTLLIECHESYLKGKKRMESLNSNTPSQGRGKRIKMPTNKNFTPTLVTARKRLIRKQSIIQEKKDSIEERKQKNEDILKSKHEEENIILKMIESMINEELNSRSFADPSNDAYTVAHKETDVADEENENNLSKIRVRDGGTALLTKNVSVAITRPQQTNNDIANLPDATSKSAKNEEGNKQPTTTTMILSDTNITQSDSQFNPTIHFTENNEELNNNKNGESIIPITSSQCIDEKSSGAQSPLSIGCTSTLSASYKISTPRSYGNTKINSARSSPMTKLNVDIPKHCHSPNEQNRLINHSSDITILETCEVDKSPTKCTDNKSFNMTSFSSMDDEASSANEDTRDTNGNKSELITSAHKRPRITAVSDCNEIFVIVQNNDATTLEVCGTSQLY